MPARPGNAPGLRLERLSGSGGRQGRGANAGADVSCDGFGAPASAVAASPPIPRRHRVYEGASTAPKEKAYSGYGKAMLSKSWSAATAFHRQGMSEALKVKKRELQSGLGAADEALPYIWEENGAERHTSSETPPTSSPRRCPCTRDCRLRIRQRQRYRGRLEPPETASCAVDANGNALVSVGEEKGRDGILYSGKKSDLDLAKDLAKDSWGNWGRAKGKLARIAAMEQEQLRKYGIQVGPANEKADESSSARRRGLGNARRPP